MDGTHVLKKKIYYHDTDCGGVVYYASYLRHLEEGRSEFCAERGIDLKGLSEKGTYFVVARAELDYKAPARYQDVVDVLTGIEKVGTASLVFLQRITRGGTLLVEARTIWVCVGQSFKPTQIPAQIRKQLEAKT